MATILQLDFPYLGPFDDEMGRQMKELAESIATEPGFRWKIWTTNERTLEAGGIYLFDDELSATAYLEKHTARLKQMGYDHFNAKLFDVNEPLTEITRGPTD